MHVQKLRLHSMIKYKQIDGVSMGSPLGPLIVNIFMTELEKVIIQELIDGNFIY